MSLFASLADFILKQTPAQMIEHGFVLVAAGYTLYRASEVNMVKLVRSIPVLKNVIDSNINKEVDAAVRSLFPKAPEGIDSITSFPKKPIDKAELIRVLELLKSGEPSNAFQRFAYVYGSDNEEHEEFVKKAFSVYVLDNALNPFAFPALRRFEVELIQMTIDMLNGPKGSVGTVTSGGTESLIMALKTYRDRAKFLFPHITEPEIVMPETGHPGFEKAGHYLGVKIVHAETDPVTQEVDFNSFKKKISTNTILLVASAPQYPHGVIDPIEKIAKLAKTLGLPLHVDACIGGFMLPWVEKLGYPVPPWDFRVDGVTSISADVHKYGFCPKGASCLIYISNDLRKFQFFTFTSWPGGLFISPSMLGSRNGGPIAAAWASLRALGEEGFLETTRKTMKAVDTIRSAIDSEIPELKVVGTPHMSILSFTSTDHKINIMAVADVMQDRFGWNCERQQKPNSLHLSLMPPHAKIADRFVGDLKVAVQAVRENPDLAERGTAAMYGMVAKIPDRSIVHDFLNAFVSKIYDREE